MSMIDPESWRERLAAAQAELDAVLAQFGDDSDSDADAEFATQARAGAFGRDWKVLQGRIDLNQTTREAVLTGADDSPEAQAVLALAKRRAAEFGAAAAAEAEEDGRPDPRDEIAEMQRSTQARGNALLARIRAAAEDPRRFTS